MKCPICEQETSASVKFCKCCGAELNRDFDSIADELIRETEEEKIQKIEEQIRSFLALAIFFFIISLTLYWIVPVPPKVDIVPYYLPKVKKQSKKDLKIPVLELKIPSNK